MSCRASKHAGQWAQQQQKSFDVQVHQGDPNAGEKLNDLDRPADSSEAAAKQDDPTDRSMAQKNREEMVRFGYYVSHEQFSPAGLTTLRQWGSTAMSSDHFHPWSERQGQSGFAWSCSAQQWKPPVCHLESFPHRDIAFTLTLSRKGPQLWLRCIRAASSLRLAAAKRSTKASQVSLAGQAGA